MKHKPTAEQEKAKRDVLGGDHTKLIAYAGASKTTSLIYISESLKGEVGKYLAFNRNIAKQAGTQFPKWVSCQTTHSLAFHAVGKAYVNAGRTIPDKNNRRLRTYEVASILGVKDGYRGETAKISRNGITYMAMQTVVRFCYSADMEIDWHHVPYNRQWDTWSESERAEVRALIIHYAKLAWTDIMDYDGKLSYEHDYYLKQYQLRHPTIKVDFLMIDEGQDTNPAVLDIFTRQGEHAQLVMVGDQYQQIYAWRGAVDALDMFETPNVAYLTKSFRFGEAVAFEANKWLTLLDAPHPLVGFEKIASERVPVLDVPRAVLCRTNAQVIAETLHYQDEGRKVYVQGGTGDIKAFAEAAQSLMMGQPVEHAELIGFDNWDEVVAYAAEDEGAKDLRIFVKLVAEYGVEKILDIARTAVTKEEYSDVVTSTAHKAKGREWDSVRIAPDFAPPEPDDTGQVSLNTAEMKLAYVAVTRAQLKLECEALNWVDDWVAAKASAEFPPLTTKVTDDGVEITKEAVS